MQKRYCREHGRDYYYFCPDCAEDIKREERKRRWESLIERTIWLPQVANPTLLAVKAFLADFIHKMSMPYDHNEHTCACLAQDIQETASRSGIRCGYVVIQFGNSEKECALVAFETDCGLKFFEPQTGDEVDVIVGHSYSARIEGLSADRIINRVTISWNDGTRAEVA